MIDDNALLALRIARYCSESRLALNRIAVVRYSMYL